MHFQPLTVANHLTTFSRKGMWLNGNQSHTRNRKHPVKVVVLLHTYVWSAEWKHVFQGEYIYWKQIQHRWNWCVNICVHIGWENIVHQMHFKTSWHQIVRPTASSLPFRDNFCSLQSNSHSRVMFTNCRLNRLIGPVHSSFNPEYYQSKRFTQDR